MLIEPPNDFFPLSHPKKLKESIVVSAKCKNTQLITEDFGQMFDETFQYCSGVRE